MYETHSHTPLCKHAAGEPEEYAAVAIERGLTGLTVTCHNPMPNGFGARYRMASEQFDEYLELVERARQSLVGEFQVLLGLEADYFPGYEDFLEAQIASADFHYVLGSVHPQMTEYRDRYWCDDPLESQRHYFTMLAQAAETRLFDCISHPDLIKNMSPDAWHPDQIMTDICKALDRIADVGIAMELNTSGVNKLITEMNPFPRMLVEMQRREIPVVVGADAHEPNRVGELFPEALDLLEQCGYEMISHFINRQRIETPIARAREALSPQATRT